MEVFNMLAQVNSIQKLIMADSEDEFMPIFVAASAAFVALSQKICRPGVGRASGGRRPAGNIKHFYTAGGKVDMTAETESITRRRYATCLFLSHDNGPCIYRFFLFRFEICERKTKKRIPFSFLSFQI